MNSSTIIAAGGALSQDADSVARVMFWHIPGGADYANAVVRSCYFNNQEAAVQFAARYDQPPELAVLEMLIPADSHSRQT